ncbi:ribokinase-like isoform X2 [Papaver somniferum]|uniref:ribokinase-like isoform X2 n=1 Tax=Papaver somniferum TaxID=3469 RepID=UPI000E6F4E10|nr:ribokinase-like isoform X2 [Papaver somniferum]
MSITTVSRHLSSSSFLFPFPSSSLNFSYSISKGRDCNFRKNMSSSSHPIQASSTSSSSLPLPQDRIVVGVGGTVVDYLATVDAFPNPDDKIRSTSLKVQGGGNAGNALTCAARLGLNSRLISKLANDAQGRGIVEELEADGVDTSHLVVSKDGNSPFTYIIVDNQRKTRTCIHTPGYPPMVPHDMTQSSLMSALDGARIVYSDVRLHETALVVAQEASRRNIPILVDAEKKRDGLDELLNLADYVVCTAKFPQAWTEASSIPSALVSMLMILPNLKFVIVTLGDDGCIMLERSLDGSLQPEEVDVDSSLQLLKQRVDGSSTIPTCISSKPSVQECHLRKCCLLHPKWRVQVVEPWELELVFHGAQIHA